VVGMISRRLAMGASSAVLGARVFALGTYLLARF
jgi:hypothetical protein